MANLQVIHKSKFYSSCKQDKSIFEFTKNNASRDGLQYKCRSCDLEYQKSRRIKNKDQMLDYSRTYQKNKRKVLSSLYKLFVKKPTLDVGFFMA